MNREMFIAVAIALLMVFGYQSTTEQVVLNTNHMQTVTVKQGDSLWTIAEKVVPAHVDVREVIYIMKEVNRLGDNAALRPGMKLQIPTTKVINRTELLPYMAQN